MRLAGACITAPANCVKEIVSSDGDKISDLCCYPGHCHLSGRTVKLFNTDGANDVATTSDRCVAIRVTAFHVQYQPPPVADCLC
jgi:hypothetical protein